MSLKSLLRGVVGTVAKGTPVGNILQVLGTIRESATVIRPAHMYAIVDRERHKVVSHLKGSRKYILYQLKREAKKVNQAYFGGKYDVVRVEIVLADAYNELINFVS